MIRVPTIGDALRLITMPMTFYHALSDETRVMVDQMSLYLTSVRGTSVDTPLAGEELALYKKLRERLI